MFEGTVVSVFEKDRSCVLHMKQFRVNESTRALCVGQFSEPILLVVPELPRRPLRGRFDVTHVIKEFVCQSSLFF